MQTRLKTVIDVCDINDELAARGIEKGECSVREAMFGTDYSNDCYKSYDLRWNLDVMLAELEKMKEDVYYRDYCYYCCAKLDYEIQKMLQEMFPELDSILVDVSW